MSERAEQTKEIRQMLDAAAKHLGVPITGRELDAISARLWPFFGKELFSVILAIGNESKFFPSGYSLENQVRKAMGKEPLKGLTAELIEKNAEELAKHGVSEKTVEGGARFLKNMLKAREPQIKPEVLADFRKAKAVEAGHITEAQAFPVDPLAELEDFGDEGENVLADLESF